MAWVTAKIGPCKDFVDKDGQREKTVIITPLRVIESIEPNGDKMERVHWGCSRFYYCQEGTCEFSRRTQDERRKAIAARGDRP